MEEPLNHIKAVPSVLPTLTTRESPEGIALGEHEGCMRSWGLLFFTLFWNGFTLCFFVPALLGKVWPAVFVSGLFLVFGVVMIVQLLMRLLTTRRFAPPELIVARWPLFIGARSPIIYRRTVRGAAANIERVTGKLLCTEVATYSQGTDTRTVREVVYEELLPELIPQRGLEQVEARWELHIPPDAPPSFTAYRNQIQWTVEVTLHLANFPDDTTPFLLVVRPEVGQ